MAIRKPPTGRARRRAQPGREPRPPGRATATPESAPPERETERAERAAVTMPPPSEDFDFDPQGNIRRNPDGSYTATRVVSVVDPEQERQDERRDQFLRQYSTFQVADDRLYDQLETDGFTPNEWKQLLTARASALRALAEVYPEYAEQLERQASRADAARFRVDTPFPTGIQTQERGQARMEVARINRQLQELDNAELAAANQSDYYAPSDLRVFQDPARSQGLYNELDFALERVNPGRENRYAEFVNSLDWSEGGGFTDPLGFAESATVGPFRNQLLIKQAMEHPDSPGGEAVTPAEVEYWRGYMRQNTAYAAINVLSLYGWGAVGRGVASGATALFSAGGKKALVRKLPGETVESIGEEIITEQPAEAAIDYLTVGRTPNIDDATTAAIFEGIVEAPAGLRGMRSVDAPMSAGWNPRVDTTGSTTIYGAGVLAAPLPPGTLPPLPDIPGYVGAAARGIGQGLRRPRTTAQEQTIAPEPAADIEGLAVEPEGRPKPLPSVGLQDIELDAQPSAVLASQGAVAIPGTLAGTVAGTGAAAGTAELTGTIAGTGALAGTAAREGAGAMEREGAGAMEREGVGVLDITRTGEGVGAITQEREGAAAITQTRTAARTRLPGGDAGVRRGQRFSIAQEGARRYPATVEWVGVNLYRLNLATGQYEVIPLNAAARQTARIGALGAAPVNAEWQAGSLAVAAAGNNIAAEQDDRDYMPSFGGSGRRRRRRRNNLELDSGDEDETPVVRMVL